MIDSALRSYFLLIEAGGHPTTTNLSDVWSDSALSAPKWLLRCAEVGDALAQLRRDQRKAVCAYWRCVLNEENCYRDAEVTARRRERSGQQLRRRVILSRAEDARSERECVERQRAYREGMGSLTVYLSPRLDALKEM